jgi:5-methylcytosine-specific restriction endonuclease McrA
MCRPVTDSHPPAAGAECAAPGTSEESPLSSCRGPRAGSLLGVGVTLFAAHKRPHSRTNARTNRAARRAASSIALRSSLRCQGCGQKLVAARRGGLPKWCESCRRIAAKRASRRQTARRAETSRNLRLSLACVGCAQPIELSSRGKFPKWCLSCRETLGKQSTRLHEKTCPLCLSEFSTRCKTQIYCSPKCGHASRRKRTHFECQSCGKKIEACHGVAHRRKFCSPRCRAEGQKKWRTCHGCGKEFNRRIWGSHSYQDKGKYCSRECYLDHRWGKGRPRKKWSVSAVERASRRSLATSLKKRCDYYEVYFDPACTREAVCERDGWKCQDCGVQCHKGGHRFNKKTRKLSLRSAEHDHITPLSVPGSPGNTFTNSQCLCRRCNGRKGKKRRGQLLIAAFAGP